MPKYSKTVSAGARLYHFDVRQDSRGAEYLSITEVNLRNGKRCCIYVHPEQMAKFTDALTAAAQNVSKC